MRLLVLAAAPRQGAADDDAVTELVEDLGDASIDDLLGEDDFDLLEDESGLLDVSDLPARRQVYDGGHVARREKARDFEQFEPLFVQKHVELREGASKLLPYPGMGHIVPGAFFVLDGVMLFIAEIGETEYKKTTVRENKRERLRCIFENGTESSMYRQSLAIRLSDNDGQIVVQTVIPEILTEDVVSGYIYVLRSLSDDPQIAGIKDLHKIGFTRDSVEKPDQERREVADLPDGPSRGGRQLPHVQLEGVGAGELVASGVRGRPVGPHSGRPQGSRL
jgi:hypothetical protein